MTSRQKELLEYIIKDPWITGKELAEKMNVTLKTVKWHTTLLHKRYKVRSRRDLVRLLGL